MVTLLEASRMGQRGTSLLEGVGSRLRGQIVLGQVSILNGQILHLCRVSLFQIKLLVIKSGLLFFLIEVKAWEARILLFFDTAHYH